MSNKTQEKHSFAKSGRTDITKRKRSIEEGGRKKEMSDLIDLENPNSDDNHLEMSNRRISTTTETNRFANHAASNSDDDFVEKYIWALENKKMMALLKQVSTKQLTGS